MIKLSRLNVGEYYAGHQVLDVVANSLAKVRVAGVSLDRLVKVIVNRAVVGLAKRDCRFMACNEAIEGVAIL